MSLDRSFFERDAVLVARDLLGMCLVHESSDGAVVGKVVETEAYLGPEDRASHAFGNRRTNRTEIMYGEKGRAYVYLIYGMYYCLNVIAGAVEGKPEAVLFRALEPVSGLDLMRLWRGEVLSDRMLTNGPGKLCMAMGISNLNNGDDMCSSRLRIELGNFEDSEEIVVASRIGVDYADDWRDKPLRFYLKDNIYASRNVRG